MASKKKDDCPDCGTGAPMWMATFADMATLLMSFFVLLIAFAEMEKQDSVMASEGQTGKNLGVQDEIPSEDAPPVNEGEAEDDALKKADADTDAGFEIVKAALAKEITDGKVEVSIKDLLALVLSPGGATPILSYSIMLVQRCNICTLNADQF